MLTDTKLRALKPRATAYRVADANGLCIEVRPTGAKVWRYRYRFAGKPSIITMGEYPGVSLADARAGREKARALLKAGTNPAHAAKAERAAQAEQAQNTFAAVAGELLAKRSREGLSAASVAREQRMIEKDLAPYIGTLPVAERLGAAVLGISHFSKGTAGRDPTERVTGSVAFGALSRVVLVAAKRRDADSGADRMLARAKSNIGPDGGGFGYAVEQIDLGNGIHASRIAWGTVLEGSARDLLGQAEADDAEAEDRRDVDSFLEDLLLFGEQTAKAIYRDAEAAGYSRDQIKRAKRRLSVQTAKTTMEGGWVWRLPPEARAASGD